MKKIVLFGLILVMGLSAFALGEQKIYSVDCQAYKDLSLVYLACGYAMPSSTGPWSETELLMMYNKIDASAVPSYAALAYERVGKELTAGPEVDLEDFGFNAVGTANLYLYGHNNTSEAFQGHEAFKADTSVPMLDFVLDFDYGENFHFNFVPAFQNTLENGIPFGIGNVSTNIMMLQDFKLGGDFDMSMPNRAYASFGGKNFSVELGRDRLSWGLGTTGNVTISDNIPRHEMARFTVFSKRFKFTYLMDFFPHKSNYYDDAGNYVATGAYKKDGVAIGDYFSLNGLSAYIGHRLEGRFFKDKLSVTLTEALMYSSKTSTVNFSVLNPAMLFHDLYIKYNSNSTLAFEADYTIIPGLNIYAQYLIDDFAGPGEYVTSDTTKGYPDATAAVLGATYQLPAFDGVVKLNGEFAFATPYCYLRDGELYNGTDATSYGIDYIVAMRFYSMGIGERDLGTGNTPIYKAYVQGYTFGPDCLVGNLNATYKGSGKLDLAANLFFMAHGTHDIFTAWQWTGAQEDWEDDYYAPSTKHLTANANDSTASSRDAVCYTADLGLAGSYMLLDKLKLSSELDLVGIWNYGNRSSSAFQFDCQLTIGASYTFL